MTSPQFTLVDIGARGGIDPRWRRFADYLRVVAIDADEHAASGNRDGVAGYDLIRSAIGSSAGYVDFYVTREPGCSSTLRPNRALLAQFPDPGRFDVVEVKATTVVPLDQALRDHDVRSVDFMKLDTQGSELSILAGAPEALASAVGLEVEVEFIPLYEGQPLFGDVDSFLRTRGFELFDLNRVYWRRSASPDSGRGQLVFADALYFRSADTLVETSGSGGPRLANAVLAALAYGYVDYARSLLQQGDQRGVFRPGDRDLASQWLARAAPRPALSRLAGAIAGAGRLSRALARLADAIRPDDWAHVDGRLGNSRK